MIERLSEYYAGLDAPQAVGEQMESVVYAAGEEDEEKEQYLEDLEAAIEELDLKETSKRTRAKSAAEAVMEEFQKRVEDDLKEVDEQQKLKPSKSYISLTATGTEDKTLNKRPSSRWDDLHQKEFEKMGSISNHYAAKRSTVSLKAVNEEHGKLVQEDVNPIEEAPVVAVETPQKTSIFQKIMNLSSSKKKKAAVDGADGKKELKKPSVVSKSMAFFKKASTAKVVAPAMVSKPVPPVVNKKPIVNKAFASAAKKPVTTLHAKPTASSTAKSIVNDENKKTLNVSTAPVMKKKFDLKASLAKPLSYKPYVGKLAPVAVAVDKPLGVSTKQNIVSSK